jgi:hypothetical protein
MLTDRLLTTHFLLFDKTIPMRKCFLPAILSCLFSGSACAQYISNLKADSVMISGACETVELIIENSTKNVPGFLYNKGNGVTEFRSVNGSAGWALPGLSGLSSGQYLGTNDGVKLAFRTNSIQRTSFDGNGTFTIGSSETAAYPSLRLYPNGNFLMNAADTNFGVAGTGNSGIRFNHRQRYLELAGTSNVFNVNGPDTISNGTESSGLFINNGDPNYISGGVKNSIIAAYGVNLPSTSTIYSSLLVGGRANPIGGIYHTMIIGDSNSNHQILNNTFIQGYGHNLLEKDLNSLWSGMGHQNYGHTYANFTGGIKNSVGSAGQLTVGNHLHNRSFAAAAIGNTNIDFSSLPYNRWDSISALSIQPGYLLFSAGNSQQINGSLHSNAMTILYSGRTQINTTGFTNSLTETDVKPKAALEVISRNSGVLLPKLSTAQRDSILAGDLYTGLLLFNTTSNQFEFYNGSMWTGIAPGQGSAVQTLKDSSQINWDLKKSALMSVKLYGNRTLAISNVVAGAKGKLIIRQDSTGRRSLTLPANSVVNNAFNGTVGLTPVAGGIDIASFEYDGDLFYWTIEKSFTSSPKTARFNFSSTLQAVPGWVDVTGNPHLAVRSGTDWLTGIGISSIATTKWRHSGGISSHNTLGRSIGNPTFAFESKVNASYWFTGTLTYASSDDCNIEINGLQSGATYNIEVLSSRDEFGISQATHLMRLVCVDNDGESFVEDINVKNNTNNLVTFYNKKPNGSGKIFLFIGKRHPADSNHPFGYINGLRITKL